MRYAILALSAITVLSACENGIAQAPAQPAIEVQRALSNAFQDAPFDTGSVTILTAEHGDLHSYTLTMCGDAVCSGGRRGTLQQTPDFTVVSGTHRGRTFYLSPGGDGWVKIAGEFITLTWEDPNPARVIAPTRWTEDEILNNHTE